MIRQYNGMKSEKIISSESLPAGGYVAKILNAEVKDYDWGSVLVISFDIFEGEQKDFFRKQYYVNTNEDKKWKGTHRFTIPDENSQYFESNKKIFNNLIYSLETSNVGYHFNWDENSLKEKLIGVIYRNQEWSFNGRTGWGTQCGAVTDIQSIRENTYKPLADKPLNGTGANTNTSAAAGFSVVANDDEDDLPF